MVLVCIGQLYEQKEYIGRQTNVPLYLYDEVRKRIEKSYLGGWNMWIINH